MSDQSTIKIPFVPRSRGRRYDRNQLRLILDRIENLESALKEKEESIKKLQNRIIETSNRIAVMSAASPDRSAPRRGRPPKARDTGTLEGNNATT